MTSSRRTPVMSSEEDESSSWLDAMRRRFERELSSDDDEDEDEDEEGYIRPKNLALRATEVSRHT